MSFFSQHKKLKNVTVYQFLYLSPLHRVIDLLNQKVSSSKTNNNKKPIRCYKNFLAAKETSLNVVTSQFSTSKTFQNN